MTKQVIQTGVAANDGTGDSLREGASKINSNFTEIYSAIGDGNSLKILTSGAGTGEVLAFNGTSFVPTNVAGTSSYSTINADQGTAIASTQGSAIDIIGGTGITTQVLNNTLVINALGGSSGSGGASVTVSENPPTEPNDGDLWYDSSIGVLAVWYNAQQYWVQTNASASFTGDITVEGGGGSVTPSATTFLELTDTPSSYIADYYIKVNSAGNGIEYVESAGSGNAASAFTFLEISAPYNSAIYDYIFADTRSGAFTVNLPTGTVIGDEVRFLDAYGTFSSNNLTISSTENIQGSADDLVVDVDYAGFSLVYVNSDIGWLLKDR